MEMPLSAPGQITARNQNRSGLRAGAPLPSVVPRFTELTNFPGLWAGPLEWADFDNDGRLDLLAVGWEAPGSGWVPRTRIYRNTGGGSFAELAGTGLPNIRNASGGVGDFNKDGNVDVLLSGQGASLLIAPFRGSGAATFTGVEGLGPSMALSASWGDYDNDGDLDVSARAYLIQGFPSAFFRNDGYDTFVNIGDLLPSYFSESSWADYNQDGFADLLASGNPGFGTVRRLFRSDGVNFTDIGVAFAPDGSTSWGDFDNDADPDLLVSGSAGNLIYRNDGSAFTAVTLGLPSSPAGSAIWGDFDNDGWLDVLAMGGHGGSTPVTKFFRNEGGASFTDAGSALPGANGPIRCADFDNDGDLDFAFDGTTSPTGPDPTFKLFRNDTGTTNGPPNPPLALTATVTDRSTRLTLSWDTALDPNQSAGFTYNLRIGTQPGSNDIFDPTSDPATGFRRLVAPGNCGGLLSRHFTNFPAGVYYWSVQAIDHCYVGSTFAPEASFMVAKPTISDIPDQTFFPDIPNSIPFVVNAIGTPVHTLTLEAAAADPSLIPSGGFAFSGTGPNRTLVVTPAHGQRGMTTVTVTVTDTNGATASDSFAVEVRHRFTNIPLGFPEGNTVWGDYDNDGVLDVLLFGSATRLYRNHGNGTFTEVGHPFPPLAGGAGAWGDYDNDGWLDLAVMGWTGSGRVTTIFRNNGEGTFTDLAPELPGLTGSLAWGDFDNDGDLDLLLSGTTGLNNSNLTDIYRNDRGAFSAANVGLPIAGLAKEPWGDYDRDGFLDLLLGTSVLRNNGNGTFTDIGAGLQGVFGGNTAWGDLDNDGYLDVAIIGFIGPGPDQRTTKAYRNNRDDTFTDIDAALVPLSNAGLAWGDFDNDGWSDLVITGTTNYTGSFWVPALAYHNNGAGAFYDRYVEFPGGYGNIQWIDYDNDGALDLLVNYADLNWPQLFHNDTPKKDTPPVAPTGLASLVLLNNDIRLVWSPATDAETTDNAGLNYNLRVGTTPGGMEVMPPHSDLATGRRWLPQRGNGSSTNLWLLKDLPVGTYYWSVQAIDPSFVGSPFAPESRFTVTNARPTISGLATQTVSHSILSPPIAFVVEDVETPAVNLVVTTVSSDTNLLGNDRIRLGGTANNRFIQLEPSSNRIGTVTVTLTVADEQGWTRTSDFVVNVINLPPAVTGLSNIDALPGAPLPTRSIQIGDAESPPDDLSLSVTSSNTNLVSNANLFLSGSGSNRFLQINPVPGARGATIIRLVATDSLGAAGTNSFTLRIGEFQVVTAGLPNVQQGAVDWGDYNNDNDLDVLICGRLPDGTAITRIYGNNGEGSFTDLGAGLPGIASTIPPTVSWGDFNQDRHLDFVLAGGGITRIYRARGNGTFTDLAAGLPASVAAAWADYDNDGDLDLVLAAGPVTSASPTRIYRNDGDGTFRNSGIALPVSSSVAAADFDNDGDVDLALGSVSVKQVLATILMRNDRPGVFTDVSAGLQGALSGSLAWGDHDQDGWLDLLATGINGNTSLTRLYRNLGNTTFALAATNLPGVNTGSGVWGDSDHDGDPDIFLVGLISGRDGGRVARLYRNDGASDFSDLAEPLAGLSWSAAAFADYNGDGKLDVLYCGTSNGLLNGSTTILGRNASAGSNSPPAAPTGLAVLPGAILSWNSAFDTEAAGGGGLTYNLRIGTNSGGAQIMSPHADPATGWRRLARVGNAGASTRWRANLPPGTYYWSVQAIDSGWAGSVFAPESRFTIPSHPPRITSGRFVDPARFKVTFEADPGASCHVWVSGDLVTWSVAGPAMELSPGQFEFTESTPMLGPRFYRVSCP